MGKSRAFKMKSATKRLPASLVRHFQYQLLIDAVTDHAIYMLDPDGVVISWNTGAQRLKGYQSRDIMGSHFEVFYTEQDRLDGVPKRALQSAAQSGRFAAEGWRVRQDGSKFWASVRIDPIREDGELLGFAKVTRDVSQHRESNLAMENLLERLTLAVDSGGIGIWDWDIKEDVLIWDDWMFRLYGLERTDSLNHYEVWERHLHPDDRAAANLAVAECLAGDKPLNAEFRIVWNDGSVHDIRGTGRLTRDAGGQPLHMIGTNRDITAFKEALRAREQIQAQVESVLANMNGYLFQSSLSPEGKLYYPYVSESLYRILAMPYEPGQDLPDIRKIVSPLDIDRVEAAIWQSARDLTPLEMEFRIVTVDGREIWINNRASVRRLADGTTIWDGFGTDISVEKRAEQQLFYLTYHDKLTGLGNRLAFEADVENAVAGVIEKGKAFSVFFIDIVDFRAMNDTLGVATGDLIIRRTAHRLQKIAGPDAIVARIAGDEFALLKRAADKAAATELAERLCAGLAEPIRCSDLAKDDPGYRIDVNIGIAGFPDEDSANAAELLQNPVPECMKRCDIALYEAKRLGRGKFCHYSDDIDHRIRNRTLLQQSLHMALANDEFVLAYQPIFEFRSGKIIAAEALVRWRHPTLGYQPPDQFIPLAEESGLIVPLGNWVLKTAMTQIRKWRRERGLSRIAVNVSGVQFSQTNFVETVENLLRETGAAPDMIELELTESTLIDCSPEMLERMNALRGMGFTLAIDDFGAGYSSLKYLSKLPVDKLKIDQWFVSQMLNDSSDAAIIRTIVALGKGLNLDVVAEGVETQAQRDFLLSENCRAGQGYLYSKPLTAPELEAVLTAQ